MNKKIWKRMGTGLLSLSLVLAGAGLICRALPENLQGKGKAAQAVIGETECTNWGLSFQKEGERPSGNAGREELKGYDAYYCGSSAEKNLYLTFDVGFENGNTEPILNTLKKEKVPAAFFCVGTYIRDHPEMVRRMEEEGHIVGNHTMHHPDMTALDEEAFKRELTEVEELYRKATGKEMKKFYRPPMGKFSGKTLKTAKAMGYKTVFWSLAYVDWNEDQQPTREEALHKLMPRTHKGAVVLLHGTSKTNARYLGEFIDRWRKAGYHFKPLTQLD